MGKVTIFLAQSNLDSALRNLRRLGVVHISHLRKPQADCLDAARDKLFRLEEALELIGEPKKEKKVNKENLKPILNEIISLNRQRNKLKEELEELKVKSGWFKDWGDISKADLKKLSQKNIFLKLYLCTRRELEKLKKEKKDKLIYLVKQKGSSCFIASFMGSQEETLGFREIEVPEESLGEIKKQIKLIEEKIKEKEEKKAGFSDYKKCFVKERKRLLKEFEFIKVKSGMAENDSLAWLRGYCPVSSVENLKKEAEKRGWGIMAAKPDKPEEVPTLIKNPRWVEIIKPVFNFMGTLPGYKEYDISFWFLIFFSLFFAMIVGDAGYGFIFLGATYFLKRKFKKVPKEPFFLSYLLSAAAIVWGALSGNWFGAEAIARLPLFNALVIERIDGFVEANRNFMIYFSFVIGVVHLSIAHAIKAFRYLNSFKVLAEIGWICILWAAFFLAGQFVERAMPDFVLLLGVAGITAVILFSNFQKNILKGAVYSLGTLPLDVISSFTDIISYIRLFAVGYATLAIAAAFNNMALGIGLGGFLGGLITAVIIFLGHSLNIMLCLMSVVVHGIRLNLLEFSGQLGMEWSGREYRPFK